MSPLLGAFCNKSDWAGLMQGILRGRIRNRIMKITKFLEMVNEDAEVLIHRVYSETNKPKYDEGDY